MGKFLKVLAAVLVTACVAWGQWGNIPNSNLTWSISDGMLTISGNGDMPFFGSTTQTPWFEHQNSFTDVIIQNGVTSIGESNFSYLSGLTTVTIGSSVTRIAFSAFERSGLTSVTIPSSVTRIDRWAFANCTELNTVNFNAINANVGNYVFAGCNNLTQINIGNQVTTIHNQAFRDLPALTTVTIGSSVSVIDMWAFSGCINLREIINNVETPQNIHSTVFEHIARHNITLRVPCKSVNLYRSTNVWSGFNVQGLPHDFSGWQATTAPTCLTDGEEIEVCSLCGARGTQTQAIERLDHSLSDWTVRIHPSCDTDGDSIIVCTRPNCNFISETKAGARLEHIWDNWIETIAPTCTIDGEETESCTLCGITGIATRPIEKLGHLMSGWQVTLPAMCEREGEEERVCTRPRCDNSEEQKISALGHLWGTWGAWRDTTATCTEDGDRSRTRTCSRCSGTDREMQAISALGHVWNGWSIWNTIIAASCTAEGSRERTRTCRACTEIENDTREIPQLTELDGCDPSSIRGRQNTDSRYGIILESAIVSDVAKISVITPELATINLSILDNLGNVVFSATEVGAGLKPAPTNVADNAITWNLTNSSGRFVANGTYLIIVEATGISGRKFTYSARIGVSK